MAAFSKLGLFAFGFELPGLTLAAPAPGSGKFDTPLARMHAANLSPVAGSGACSGSPPCSAVDAAVRYRRQVTPAPVLSCPLGPAIVPKYPAGVMTWIAALASMVGSAWLGSP